MKPYLSIITASTLCLTLTACFDDSDGSSDSDEQDTASEASGFCPNSEGQEDREELLRLVNEARESGYTCGDTTYEPAEPLSWHCTIESAARGHSKDMVSNDFFSHTGSEGSQPSQRLDNEGYTGWTAVGENIAAGQPTPAAVVQGWLDSPGHCSNIMNPAFEDMGVAHELASDAQYSIYWTQKFGAQ
ncbi:MAG: CAP domain-containing protein [Natronospirillum sp.]|uniref:CAP domain-containing protein n=1 Tax=Natronospirillum sp. TaxID=2812955 RepID=UPI0025DC26D9|nr:CAP domain-containing protein [Natronospirillum sp.]MCH8550884.1 CAP domain-containing protein [Natronospirillum sp.]